MICNPNKCKELAVRKKYNNTQYEQICNIPQCNSLSLLGVPLVFPSLVIPNFTYCLSVYGESEPDLDIIQRFLDRCHKRRFVSFPVSSKDLLYRPDCKILKAIFRVVFY